MIGIKQVLSKLTDWRDCLSVCDKALFWSKCKLFIATCTFHVNKYAESVLKRVIIQLFCIFTHIGCMPVYFENSIQLPVPSTWEQRSMWLFLSEMAAYLVKWTSCLFSLKRHSNSWKLVFAAHILYVLWKGIPFITSFIHQILLVSFASINPDPSNRYLPSNNNNN